MFSFEQITATVSSWVWGTGLVALCLLSGLFFSILTRFVQVRRFKEMCKLLFTDNKSRKIGISSFQAFAMALSGRVGTGNIVGVATAIGYGGPGAIVWMWIIAFLGAGSAFVEATLAQIYKVEHNGEFRGGPSYYAEKGLKSKWIGILFAISALVACGFLMPTVQSNSIATAFEDSLNIRPLFIGLTIAAILALVIIGGVGRIAKVAQIVAPFMAIIYVVLAIIILIVNYQAVPGVISDLFSSAFGTNAIFGGIMGSAISYGVKRGIYSNEAGQGTGPIVAAAANVSHPVKQGLVQAFSVYVDTLLVCTMTAVMVLATKCYNVIDPATGEYLFSGALTKFGLGEPDVKFTTAAVGTLLGHKWGGIIISFALAFFSFTTILAYYYYAETSAVYLFGKGRIERTTIWILRLSILTATVMGAVWGVKTAWNLGDIGVGIMAWINIIVILLLSPKAIRALKDYEKQKRNGVSDPVFNPSELGIKGADYWEKKQQFSPPTSDLSSSQEKSSNRI